MFPARITFLSVTVDPERDTPTVLSARVEFDQRGQVSVLSVERQPALPVLRPPKKFKPVVSSYATFAFRISSSHEIPTNDASGLVRSRVAATFL